jgi:hypothetical protein
MPGMAETGLSRPPFGGPYIIRVFMAGIFTPGSPQRGRLGRMELRLNSAYKDAWPSFRWTRSGHRYRGRPSPALKHAMAQPRRILLHANNLSLHDDGALGHSLTVEDKPGAHYACA